MEILRAFIPCSRKTLRHLGIELAPKECRSAKVHRGKLLFLGLRGGDLSSHNIDKLTGRDRAVLFTAKNGH